MKKIGFLAAAMLVSVISPFFPAFSRDFSDFGMPQEQPPAKSKPKPTGDDKAPPPPRTPKIAPAAAPIDPPGLKVGDMWTDSVSGIDFMWVPGGKFVMGCSGAWAGECDDHEKPARQVTVRGFWMGRTEVTQAQWERVMGNNPSAFKGANLPVDTVSWNDAQAFIHALNGRRNGVFRLPSESEWEYACRSGGKEELYCGGGDVDALGWYKYFLNINSQPHPVAEKQANDLGLYDMSGNVWEWVADCYVENYHGAPVDGLARKVKKICENRAMRGGSWIFTSNLLRSTNRGLNAPNVQANVIGFRIATTIIP